ncbi:AraC family transcriptional regulator [Mycobacteroides franklinii]|uniref:HTH-type transcriptional regulator VirS n=1 Tax=Mycobacteroides franklinii TaxID=948102 RepID=A0A4R8QZW9_9MYCO|nr:AraC family transcriptional regulator [Mycobacteroides franklinii]TDZ46299.1 HTH-type transcriptional regulator VirS [Mycobacteroides franklinii]TDZ47808.1 HTH-type transcriptional regulator VirS [Mycobacteroides franklinii]TDZ60016.1 HTH-type transcriptional regulator VirS [Mycobacteroides franklinii]TDZ65415.1 HTH-type transcriptional regulator VirS [Mycobacteroides franklinii]TDZ73585.1 HTH-type transcriptional regulator VirS [Mycobacteroides franklinii]
MELLSIPPHWGALATELAQRQGMDAAKMLMDAQVSPRFLAGEPVAISPEQVRVVTCEVLARTGDLSFGTSPAPVPPETLQVLMFSLATSETTGAAFARWAAFRDAMPLVPSMTAVRSGDFATVALEASTLTLPDATFTVWALALVVRIWSWLTMRSIRVERILLPQAQPDGRADHSNVFKAPIEFGNDSAAIILDAKLLDVPILRTEEEITSLLERPEQIWFDVHGYHQQLPNRVERIIGSSIGQGIPTVSDIASALNMAPSALQRSLRSEFGTSIRQIRDSTLHAEAIRSLAGGSESLNDLSLRLGFSELSAFTRAFRRWTGATPAQYRDGARSVK